jgi:HPt (histidine-containing phosphotransfer) domain-containing protein
MLVLDQDTLAGLRELGADEFRELIRLFINEAAGRVDALRVAVVSGDRRSTAALAHSLRGSCVSFGAAGLAGCCVEIEDAIARDGRRLEGLVEATAAEFHRVSAALTKELA